MEFFTSPVVGLALGAGYYLMIEEKSDQHRHMLFCACVAVAFSVLVAGLSLMMIFKFISVTYASPLTLFVLSGLSTIATSFLLVNIKRMATIMPYVCVAALLSLAQCMISIATIPLVSTGVPVLIFVVFIISAVTIIIQALTVGYIHREQYRSGN